MNLFAALNLRNRTAPSALDWLCAKETMAEILDALTPQQLVIAALLADGMQPLEIAEEEGISLEAVHQRRRRAQMRVAGALYHANAEHLHGDVLARAWPQSKAHHGPYMAICCDCGREIYHRSTRCQSCAQLERRRREREEAA